MDRNHSLDAPNNDELSGIEQITDHSDLTNIYRDPHNQFEGNLLSANDRQKVKADELEAITSGLGKHVLKIGVYVPLPLIIGALLAVSLYTFADTAGEVASEMVLAFAAILSISIWLIILYKTYKAINKTFYKHAMRAGSFLIVMIASLLMASQAIYWIVSESYLGQSLLFYTALTSLLVVMYSLVASFILLGIWGNSRLNSGIKALVSGLILLVSGFFVVATYLF